MRYKWCIQVAHNPPGETENQSQYHVDGIKQKRVQSAMEMQRKDWLLTKSSQKEHLPQILKNEEDLAKSRKRVGKDIPGKATSVCVWSAGPKEIRVREVVSRSVWLHCRAQGQVQLPGEEETRHVVAIPEGPLGSPQGASEGGNMSRSAFCLQIPSLMPHVGFQFLRSVVSLCDQNKNQLLSPILI